MSPSEAPRHALLPARGDVVEVVLAGGDARLLYEWVVLPAQVQRLHLGVELRDLPRAAHRRQRAPARRRRRHGQAVGGHRAVGRGGGAAHAGGEEAGGEERGGAGVVVDHDGRGGGD